MDNFLRSLVDAPFVFALNSPNVCALCDYGASSANPTRKALRDHLLRSHIRLFRIGGYESYSRSKKEALRALFRFGYTIYPCDIKGAPQWALDAFGMTLSEYLATFADHFDPADFDALKRTSFGMSVDSSVVSAGGVFSSFSVMQRSSTSVVPQLPFSSRLLASCAIPSSSPLLQKKRSSGVLTSSVSSPA